VASIFVCGFECQTQAAAGAMHWPTRGGTATTLTIDTTTVRSGAASLRILTSAQAGRFVHDLNGTTPALAVLRIYFRFASFPTTEQDFIRFTSAVAPNGEVRCDGTGQLRVRVGATDGAYIAAISLDTWYRLDVRFDRSTTNAVLDWRLDGVEQTQLAVATGAASTISTLFVGWGNASTADVYFDDCIIGTASGDFPFGAGFVKGYSPDRDGTHTAYAAGVFIDEASVNIPNNTTTAWQRLDDVPITTSTDFNAQATNSTTDYMEHGFAPSTESTAPVGVDAVIAYNTQSATNGNITFRLLDGASPDDIFSGTVNSSGIGTKSKHYATKPSGGAWTDGAFDVLLLRFGFSSDAAPDIRLHAAMLEAAFGEAAVGAGMRNQIVLVG
jgi:hypothetical protein